MKTFEHVHENFANILRFTNRSPHVFATVSFDTTCKVWDLREPLMRERPVTVLNTNTLNVMCCFSPDDKYLLISGVDKALHQFDVAGGFKSTTPRTGGIPIPALPSATNY